MNPTIEGVLCALALEKLDDRSQSDRFQIRFDTLSKRREHLADLLDAFPHPVPLDLESITVVNDMPEPAEGAELAGQGVIKQNGQWRMAGWAEPLEQIKVPVLARGQLDTLKPAQALENVFDAGIGLGEECRRCRLLAYRWFTTGQIRSERFELARHLSQGRELDGDLGLELLGRHKSTRARFSINRVKGVGGSSGTRSSGILSDSSKAADNSKSFQPGTPAHAKSRSRACAGFSSALPNNSNRVAPNCCATHTTFVRTVSRSIITRRLPPPREADNHQLPYRHWASV